MKRRRSSLKNEKENIFGRNNERSSSSTIHKSIIVINEKPRNLITTEEVCVETSPKQPQNEEHLLYTKNRNMVKTPFRNYEKKSPKKKMKESRTAFGQLDGNCSDLTRRIPQLSNGDLFQKEKEDYVSYGKKIYKKRTPSHENFKRNDSFKIAKRLSGYDKIEEDKLNCKENYCDNKQKRRSHNYNVEQINNSKLSRNNSRNKSFQRKNSLNNPLERKVKNRGNSQIVKPPKSSRERLKHIKFSKENNEKIKKLKQEIKSVLQEIKKTDEDIDVINHTTIISFEDVEKFKKFVKRRKEKIKKYSKEYKKLITKNQILKNELKTAYKLRIVKDKKIEEFKNSKNKEIEGLDLEMMKNRMLKKKVKEMEINLKNEMKEKINLLEERTKKQLENEKIGLNDLYGNNISVVKRELREYVEMLGMKKRKKDFGVKLVF